MQTAKMTGVFKKFRDQRGFTLIELSIVMVIAGLLLAGFLQFSRQYFREKIEAEQTKKMDEITAALRDHFTDNSAAGTQNDLSAHYPCPASPTVGIGQAGFGVEARIGNINEGTAAAPDRRDGLDCDTTTGVISVPSGGDIVYIGSVPTQTLGISSENMIDAYGRRFTYAVSRSAATSGSNANGQYNAALNGRITIEQTIPNPTTGLPGPPQVLNNQVFTLVTHGPDGVGAFQLNGVQINCPASAAAGGAQRENCDNDARFVDNNLFRATAGGARQYDDTIVFNNLSGIDDQLWERVPGTTNEIRNIDWNTVGGGIGIGTANPTQMFDVEGQFVYNAANNRVGIGTTNPAQRLDVAGNVQMADLLSTQAQFDIVNNSGNGIAITGANGFLGVGTVAPVERLHVEGRFVGEGARIGNLYAGVWDGGNGYAAFTHDDLKGTVTSYALLQRDTGETFLNAAAGQPLRFRINNGNGFANRDAMTIAANRNVGINTQTPASLLDIEGATSTYNLRLDGGIVATADNTLSDLIMSGNGVISALDSIVFNIDADNNTTGVRAFLFRHNAATTNSTANEIMRIQDDGNVGIGVTAPQATLDIAGQIKIANGNNTCNAAREGAVRYITTSKILQFCNGTSWISAAGGRECIMITGNLGRANTWALGTGTGAWVNDIIEVTPGQRIWGALASSGSDNATGCSEDIRGLSNAPIFHRFTGNNNDFASWNVYDQNPPNLRTALGCVGVYEEEELGPNRGNRIVMGGTHHNEDVWLELRRITCPW